MSEIYRMSEIALYSSYQPAGAADPSTAKRMSRSAAIS